MFLSFSLSLFDLHFSRFQVFQNAKYAKINAGEALHGDYARGFLTSGLFRYSRHPNFFSEQVYHGLPIFQYT